MIKTLATTRYLPFFLFLVIVLRSAQALSSQPQDVRVQNLPDMQQIKGSVSIEGTISHAKFFKKEGIVVSPSRRTELSELIRAGTIETEGFISVTLSLQGEIRSDSFGSGVIGVILIPDEEPIVRSLREARRLQFVIEGVANIKTGDSSYFASEQVQKNIAFPRYRVYLYNTLGKTAEANVYLYLTN